MGYPPKIEKLNELHLAAEYWEDTRYSDGIIPDESEYFLDDEPGKRINR